MKLLRIAALGLLVGLCAVRAHADSIPTGDPVIKTGGGGGIGLPARPGNPLPAPAGIITPEFSIFSKTGTSPGASPCVLIQGTVMTTTPRCLFENDITVNDVGLAITQLVFDIGGVNPDTVTCGFLMGSPFANCNVSPFGEGGTQVTFNQGLGIPFHTDFRLDFEGFPANSTFATTASTVPEPGTLALFLGGIGALLARRRSRTR